MNKFKYFFTFVLVLSLLQFTFAEKRAKPLPMKELTDPASPSYVPYPYPKTKQELIADMKYAIKKFFLPSEDRHEVIIGPLPGFRKVLPNLLEENPMYKIGKIIKVKNLLSRCPYDYYWQIYILNEDDSKAACVVMVANGLYGGSASDFPKDKPIYIKTEDDILGDLAVTLGRNITKKDIKHMQAIELPPRIGSLFNPAYEIKLKSGDAYYYSSGIKEFFRVKEELPWKKNKKGHRRPCRELAPHPEIYAYDQINDKIMLFEKLQKKE
jgi:hypothetical protein